MSGPTPPDEGAPEVQERIRSDWNERARRDARHHIAPGEEDPTTFALSGLRDAFRILEDLHPHLRPDMRLLEIGCGIGRLLQYWARVFREVWGIDASSEMVRQARELLAGIPNAHVQEGDAATLSPFESETFDVVVSYVVFQHVPTKEIVRSYMGEAFRVLVPGGIAKFHVKTAPWAGQEGVDTWNGVDLTVADWNEWNAGFGFETLSTYSEPDTAGLTNTGWIVARKPEAPAAGRY